MSDLIPMLGGDRRREVPEDDAPVAETRFVLSMASYNISDGVFRTNEAIITLDGVELGVVRTIRYGADEYVRIFSSEAEVGRAAMAEGCITLEVDMSDGAMATLYMPQSQISVIYAERQNNG